MGRIKIVSFPRGWFLLYYLLSCLSLRRDFEGMDFMWPFSPHLKGTGCWDTELTGAQSSSRK